MNADNIKQYWSERVASTPESATTNDVFLRRIEFRALSAAIYDYYPALVADVGCGDGKTTRLLATACPQLQLTGYDFSPAMIQYAQAMQSKDNLRFCLHDISQPLPSRYNLIYTTRCLNNLPTWEDQQQAIDNIHHALLENGIYIMIENYIEGHDAINEQRVIFGLPKLAIRHHNLFFIRRKLLRYISGMFDIIKEANISSTYYLMTRVIYSRICMLKGVEPDYLNIHQELAADLPWAGEYGPLRMIVMRRK